MDSAALSCLNRLARLAMLVVIASPGLAFSLEAVSGQRLDERREARSPFRLVIQRSEYRVNTGQRTSTGGKSPVAGRFAPLIERHAEASGLDPALVHAVIQAESAYRADAISPKGAVGLMQVMPATGKRFGIADLDSPESNVKAGTIYLRRLLDRFENVPLALAAYNAGEGAVVRHGNTIPPYAETRGYVQEVLRLYGVAVVPVAVSPRVYADGVRLADGTLGPYRLVDGWRGP